MIKVKKKKNNWFASDWFIEGKPPSVADRWRGKANRAPVDNRKTIKSQNLDRINVNQTENPRKDDGKPKCKFKEKHATANCICGSKSNQAASPLPQILGLGCAGEDQQRIRKRAIRRGEGKSWREEKKVDNKESGRQWDKEGDGRIHPPSKGRRIGNTRLGEKVVER